METEYGWATSTSIACHWSQIMSEARRKSANSVEISKLLIWELLELRTCHLISGWPNVRYPNRCFNDNGIVITSHGTHLVDCPHLLLDLLWVGGRRHVLEVTMEGEEKATKYQKSLRQFLHKIGESLGLWYARWLSTCFIVPPESSAWLCIS